MITKRNFLAKNTGWAVAVPLISATALWRCARTMRMSASPITPTILFPDG